MKSKLALSGGYVYLEKYWIVFFIILHVLSKKISSMNSSIVN